MDLKQTVMWKECAALVDGIKNFIIRAYYHLTAYIPRRLPTDHAELNDFRGTLQQYFGLEDKHEVWLTVYGHIQSTPATSLRKSYGSIANAAKRLQVNKTAQEQKIVAIQALQLMLKENMEGMTNHEIVQKAQGEEISGHPA